MLALVMILLLAVVAISGEMFTGRLPSPEEADRLAEARETGGTVNLDVNPRAIADPGRTELADKLKPPFSKSEVDDGRTYLMGTDHLGRDIAAQLWAGSSISLTIGFLAVGISVLLGVALGGIAGFFGRQRVRLPLMVSLMLALAGAIAIPAEAPTVGRVLLAAAAVVFAFQCVVALLGKRYRPLLAFGVAALIALSVYGFNSYIERTTPEGKRHRQAVLMADASKDLLLQLRDLSRERVRAESGVSGAMPEEWLLREQLRYEVDYRRLQLQLLRLRENEFKTGLTIEERSIAEALAWADHLEAVTDKREVEGERPSDEAAAARYDRLHARLRLVKETRKDALRRQARLERVLAALPAAQQAVDAELGYAADAIAMPEDLDAESTAAQLRLMLSTHMALQRVEFAFTIREVAEGLADVGAALHGDDWRSHVDDAGKALFKEVEELHKQAAALRKDGKAAEAEAAEIEAEGKIRQAQAGVLLAAAEARLADLGDVEGSELLEHATELQQQADSLRSEGKVAEADAAEAEADDKKRQARSKALLQELLTPRRPTQNPGGAMRAAEIAKSIVDAPGKSTKILREWNKTGEEGVAARSKLLDYDYGIDNRDERNALFFSAEPSNRLLNRRAQLRARFVKIYEAEAAQLFDGGAGITQVREADGSRRYGVYRVTRHFLSVTFIILLLVVTGLAVAGAAQGAAQDLKGPIEKFFVPTITVDDLVMRFTEIMMTIPVIFLILAVLALFERDVYIVMGVIGLTSWMGMTRFVRAEILSLREQDFIQAARSLGVSDFRIVWRHLVPNAISPVLVSATIGVATAVLAESTLSFLGIGAGPDQHTWGQILSNGRAYIADAPWMTWIPGIAILITVLSFNLLGEGLREAFNPKLRGR